jgi:hypothetical protein
MVVAELHRVSISCALATPCSNILIASSPSTTPNRLEAKPGTSFTTIGSFRILLTDFVIAFDGLGAGLFSNNDFNQSHDMHRIEKVHTDNSFGAFEELAISVIDSDEVLLAKMKGWSDAIRVAGVCLVSDPVSPARPQ